jgi:hypothetical protein
MAPRSVYCRTRAKFVLLLSFTVTFGDTGVTDCIPPPRSCSRYTLAIPDSHDYPVNPFNDNIVKLHYNFTGPCRLLKPESPDLGNGMPNPSLEPRHNRRHFRYAL